MILKERKGTSFIPHIITLQPVYYYYAPRYDLNRSSVVFARLKVRFTTKRAMVINVNRLFTPPALRHYTYSVPYGSSVSNKYDEATIRICLRAKESD